jgi:Cytochrome C oxidase, cbb3-type, subunit III
MTEKPEIRNPKSEGMPKSEIRNTEVRRSSLSAFGFLSDFRCGRLRRFVMAMMLSATAVGCRRDMFHQPSSRPLEPSDFFQDNHMASRPVVAHTVARGHLEADEALYKGKIGTNLVETFPFPITREVLDRGRERFDIYCSPCHGRTGEGNGMIVQRGFPAPPSYHIDRLRQAPVGHFYDVITQGYGIMYSYASRVEPADRWAIAAYIRALQRSQDARLAEVPPPERNKLEDER